MGPTLQTTRKPGSISLTAWIFICMILGVLVGSFWPSVGIALAPYGKLFITMIKVIIAPLIFSTLVVGIAGTGSMKTVGRIGFKALVYFEIATTIALVIGLTVVNLLKPGDGINLTPAAGVAGAAVNPAELASHQQSFSDIIQHLFTPSIVDSMARGDVLQIVIFTIIFAAALLAVGEKGKPILRFCESLSEVMFQFTGYVMKFAPIGVGAAIAAVVGEHGLSVLVNLSKLIGSLYLALGIFIGIVLIPAALLIRLPLKRFFNAVKEPALLAFSTTSSEAALPKAMQAMEEIGVPRSIVGFVMPTGYSFNLDGTTLYLAMASMFVAQAAGVHMSLSQQIIMMLTLMITSKGVAAVPRASLVILAGTLASFHLPVEGVLVILGVDSVMDMARTATNVMGNCMATAVVARWEGSYSGEVTSARKPVEVAVSELAPEPDLSLN